MRRIEIVRGIIGILLFVTVFGVLTYRMLTKPQETTVKKDGFVYYAQAVDQEDKKASSEDLLKVEEERIITYNDKEYSVRLDGNKPYRNPNYPYASVVYKAENGDEFTINIETGDVVEYIACINEKTGEALSISEREEIARKYANEIRDIKEYRMSYEERYGNYEYTFIKYVGDFKTTDEIDVVLTENGTLYILCHYMIGEFDELDKMYEAKDGEDKSIPRLDKTQIDKVVYEKIKEQFGDTVTYEEKAMNIVKRRNGEFAVLVVADILDEKGEYIETREYYYITWE